MAFFQDDPISSCEMLKHRFNMGNFRQQISEMKDRLKDFLYQPTWEKQRQLNGLHDYLQNDFHEFQETYEIEAKGLMLRWLSQIHMVPWQTSTVILRDDGLLKVTGQITFLDAQTSQYWPEMIGEVSTLKIPEGITSLKNVQKIEDLHLDASKKLEAPYLQEVGEIRKVENELTDGEYHFPSLETAGLIDIKFFDSFSAPKLEQITKVAGFSLGRNVLLPNVKHIYGGIDFEYISEHVDISNLEKITIGSTFLSDARLYIQECPKVSASKLKKVGKDLTLLFNDTKTIDIEIDLSSLEEVGGSFDFLVRDQAHVNLSHLQKIGGYLDAYSIQSAERFVELFPSLNFINSGIFSRFIHELNLRVRDHRASIIVNSGEVKTGIEVLVNQGKLTLNSDVFVPGEDSNL